MKITKLETLCLSRMHAPHEQWITAQYRTVKADCTIVVVHTDTDIKGIGEASSYGWPLNIRDWVDYLAPTLIGADPEDPAIAPQPVGNNRGHDGAAAGIDCALWDIRGQAAGKSVNELITGTSVDSVPLYASSGCRYDWRHNPEQLFREAEEYIERGFGVMKFRIGTDWSWDGITVDRFLDHVRELVRVVDGRMKLALDGNCRLTPEESLPIARELDRLGFAWFEEPMPWSDVDSYAELNRAVELPITGGESFATLAQMRPYLDAGAYDVVQPDAGFSGITELLRIGKVAEDRGVKLYPHSWHNGLMGLANGHVVASLSNSDYLELCMIQGPLQWAFAAEPPEIKGGRLHFPTQGGFGIELAENLEQRYPYIEGTYSLNVERGLIL